MGFTQAQLPGAAGVFHRGQRACAGAAVITGDGDQIRVALRDPGGDGANPGFGYQLYRHQRLGVNLLQIEDELRQILDGVNVVVGRRRNERHPGA